MDITALLLLLLLGIIISGTSGRYNSSEELDALVAVDGEVPILPQPAELAVPHHISNQHQVLRRLSQAMDGSNKASGANRAFSETPADQEDDGFHEQHQPHHSHPHHHPNSRFHGSNGFLRRVMLKNSSVTCNDGTRAGYYLRHSYGSKRWIVFLEGGWYCFSTVSCHQRWLRVRNLMTSAHWPEMRSVGGIMSPNPEENPFWHNANHVFIPYCSSDTWSGDLPAKSPGDLAFLGSRIVEQVFMELLPRGLYDASLVMLAGSSAGAVGVLVNLDRIAGLLAAMGSKVEVRGLADSGWFLDNKPFDFRAALASESGLSTATPEATPTKPPTSCRDPGNCAPIESIKQGIKLWNGQVPSSCRAQYQEEPWRCYMGYRMYPTLRTPLFVVQWIFDEAQMTMDNVGAPVTRAQWNYIHRMGQEVKRSLENVTAVFAPSCISHIILTKRDWNQIKINRISLPQALRCWELQPSEHNHHGFDLMFNPVITSKVTTNNDNAVNKRHRTGSDSDLLSDSPVDQMLKLNASPTRGAATLSALPSPPLHTHIPLIEKIKKKKRKRKHRRRHQHMIASLEKKTRTESHNRTRRSTNRPETNQFNHERHRWLMHEDLCHHWLLDTCSWPQCNRGCPRLHNPFTGEEVDFIQLLKSFGLNMSLVAEALGIDQQALSEMDHEALLQILTQQR